MAPNADEAMRWAPNGDATHAMDEHGIGAAEATLVWPSIRDAALGVPAADRGGDLIVTHGRPPR